VPYIPVGLSVVFVLAALGGLFWPLYDLPSGCKTAAYGTVTTWSMFAVQDVILRDKNLAEVSSKLLIGFVGCSCGCNACQHHLSRL
jgi:hypothetical protein